MTCRYSSDMRDTPYLYDNAVMWLFNIMVIMRLFKVARYCLCCANTSLLHKYNTFTSDCPNLGQISDLMPPLSQKRGGINVDVPLTPILEKISKPKRNGVITL